MKKICIFIIPDFTSSKAKDVCAETEQFLKNEGFQVVNPFSLGLSPAWMENKKELTEKLQEVLGEHCNSVLVLNGWRQCEVAKKLLAKAGSMRAVMYFQENRDLSQLIYYKQKQIIC